MASFSIHKRLFCAEAQNLVILETGWYGGDYPYSKAIEALIGDSNPERASFHVTLVPFNGLVYCSFVLFKNYPGKNATMEKLKKLFPGEKINSRIDVLIIAGHGDMVKDALEYNHHTTQRLTLVRFQELVHAFLPLVKMGMILSSCGTMEDPSIYGRLYSGDAWLAGYPDLSSDGKTKGVEYTQSALDELSFLKDICFVDDLEKLFRRKYSPSSKKFRVVFPSKLK